MEFDPKTQCFTGPLADGANARIKGDYREGFTIPELARVEAVPGVQ